MAKDENAAIVEHATMRPMPLVNNFRNTQSLGPYRLLYKSPQSSSTCHTSVCEKSGSQGSSTCLKEEPVEAVEQEWGTSTMTHWSYYDQTGWYRYVAPYPQGPNECSHPPVKYTYPGQSPINVDPSSATVVPPPNAGSPVIQLSKGFSIPRPNLILENDGYVLKANICGNSAAVDCMATANFGLWPQVLRGADPTTVKADQYYLSSIQLHWGSDDSHGSEHTVCGQASSGELQMIFKTMRDLPEDRNDPDAGTQTVILTVLLEAGALSDNLGYAPLINNASSLAKRPGDSDPVSSPIVLSQLLPANYTTQWYTYAGSLTTPPCTQKATWFVFENIVRISDSQLATLRQLRAQTAERGHESMAAKALLFPFTALAMGTLTHHLLERFIPAMPYTVVILIEGLLLDLIADSDKKTSMALDNPEEFKLNSMEESLDIWADIDGHLLLIVFLPGLLFGDSVALNVHLFKKCLWQCLLLAGPGVVFGTIFQGIVAYYLLPYNWPWNLALSFGGMLAATDPVAVVANLKSAGASETLTMIITGESLLNDGTAMVMFTLFWNMYMDWERYDAGSIIAFFLRMAIAAPILGCCIGVIGYLWMSKAARSHSHVDSTIQTSVTLFAAYLSYYVADMELGMSGVLCVIFTALGIANFVWPVMSSRPEFEAVWHCIEFLGNTVLFFLAGVLIRRAIWDSHITGPDFGWVIVMYLFMVLIRTAMITLCYPIMVRIGGGTSIKDSAFMVWGGLRGGVAIALAIYVRAVLQGVDDRAGAQVVFHVAGIAFLTICFNGITSGPFLKFFGMVGLTETQKEMIHKVHERVKEHAAETYEKLCLTYQHDAVEIIEIIGDLRHILGTEHERPALTKALTQPEHIEDGAKEEAFSVETLEHILSKCMPPEDAQVTVMRETLMSIVRSEYWELIESGKLPKRSTAALKLTNSVAAALDVPEKPLADWEFISPGGGTYFNRFLDFCEERLPSLCTWDSELFYTLKVRRHEEAYYACVSFIEAHQNAQQKLAMFFGDKAGPDLPEEVAVLLESQKEVAQAREFLENMSQGLIKIVKTNIIGNCLLESIKDFVAKLIDQGIISEDQSGELTADIDKEFKALKKVVRKKMQEARSQVTSELRSDSNTPTTIGIKFDKDGPPGGTTVTPIPSKDSASRPFNSSSLSTADSGLCGWWQCFKLRR